MNNYKEFALQYHDKGLSVIPDKFGTKLPAIKEWSRFCDELSSLDDITKWSNTFNTSNISLCLGEASGIIALDVDTEDQKILDLIVPLLPKSPVEKLGAKGFTRFFKYSGEHTQQIKFNGLVVLEILSGGKKTTLPPSKHPSGVNYKWVSEKTLLDIKAEELPIFPPFLISNIESKLRLHFGDLDVKDKTNIVSGRNNDLSKLCGQLIADRVSLDKAVKTLVDYDKTNHTPPLFSDPQEMNNTNSITNALVFYSNHLQTVNNKHYKKGEEYEIPVITPMEDSNMGKQVGQKSPERNKSMLKHVSTVTKICPCCKGWK
jgi:Bifunctional DNA primase/polymerase, N-terminal